MDLIRLSISKPVAVSVAVILTVLFGILAVNRIPVQLTPNVDSTVINISTNWTGASPQEVEREIIEKQEDKLKGTAGLKKMTSSSSENGASINLEFHIGNDKDAALREVGDRLREVPDYPEGVDEPVIVASDPNNRDYIAWIMFETTDKTIDIRTLQDFAEDEVKPMLENVQGISEIRVLGGREQEVQVRFDPVRMAQLGVDYSELIEALRAQNTNVSAGSVEEGKLNVRVRTVGRFTNVQDVDQTIITYTDAGPIRIEDVAQTVLTFKEPHGFVRSKGVTVLAINAQREIGTNVMEVMDGLKAALARLNEKGGTLESYARKINLDGTLSLRQVYDQTIYIEQAIRLVRSNIFIGGTLAMITLMLFLRSIRSVGVIALAIPISIVGTFVAMVAMGRNLNVISLAGMAFAVGMVVDNAIVVLENIFRHLEMGESPAVASYRGTREVWGAVLASTLTTVAVFVPILFIQEEAGQLFRDIALAICASVSLSLIVSITVIPSAANRWLRFGGKLYARKHHDQLPSSTATSSQSRADHAGIYGTGIAASIGRGIYRLTGSIMARVILIVLFAAVSILGSYRLMPPTDYLPKGNRNLVFGAIISPPGYNLDTMEAIGDRVQDEVRPFWESYDLKQAGDLTAYEEARQNLSEVPISIYNPFAGNMVPPDVPNYFFVGFGNFMFHGAISDEDERVVDIQSLLNYATRPENAPGTIGFAQQAQLFRGGGSSISVEFSGDDIAEVTKAASAALQVMRARFGMVGSSPGNFNIDGPELQIVLKSARASDLGLTTRDVGLAIRALSDGAIIGEFNNHGQTIDLTLIDAAAVQADGRRQRRDLYQLADTPIVTPGGQVIPLSAVANLIRTTAPQQIDHIGERRSVSLQITPDGEKPLEESMREIEALVTELRESGAIPDVINTQLAGSADKLSSVSAALLGDGTLTGFLTSRLFLALLVTYLLMCVLFESFLYPIAILLSVPLATLGGFMALWIVHRWSVSDPYMPDQNLDVLTMLGFIILIGVVVNNAILIVHQSLNFIRGSGEAEEGMEHQRMEPRRAIAESVRTRLRPILMSTLTSVGGMLPLVLMPGSGSELYRGLGSVVVGGLVVSTIFTLLLVPMLFSLILDLQKGFSSILGRTDSTPTTLDPIPAFSAESTATNGSTQTVPSISPQSTTNLDNPTTPVATSAPRK